MDQFGEAESAAIDARAILHREKGATIANDDCPARPRRRAIDDDGVEPMRAVGAAKAVGEKHRHAVAIAPMALFGADEPEAPVPLHQRRIADVTVREQHGVAHPAIGKPDGAIEHDFQRRAAFGDHVDVARMRKDLRIGEVMGLFQHHARHAEPAIGLKFGDGQDALAGCIGIFLYKEKPPPVLGDDERIGVEALAVVGKHGEGRAIEPVPVGDTPALDLSIADLPAERTRAELVAGD